MIFLGRLNFGSLKTQHLIAQHSLLEHNKLPGRPYLEFHSFIQIAGPSRVPDVAKRSELIQIGRFTPEMRTRCCV